MRQGINGHLRLRVVPRSHGRPRDVIRDRLRMAVRVNPDRLLTRQVLPPRSMSDLLGSRPTGKVGRSRHRSFRLVPALGRRMFATASAPPCHRRSPRDPSPEPNYLARGTLPCGPVARSTMLAGAAERTCGGRFVGTETSGCPARHHATPPNLGLRSAGHAECTPRFQGIAEGADLQALLMPEEGLEPPTRGL